MSNQIETELCPTCNRKLKPGIVKINGREEYKLVCRYCNPVKKGSIKKEKVPMKGVIIPEKCPDCESKNIKLASIDKEGVHHWKCKDCKSCFRWHKYIFSFHIEVNVVSTPEDAEDISWELLDDGEPELLGYWKDGEYDAHVSLKIKEKGQKEYGEICKYCKHSMKFVREYDDKDGYDVFVYQCENEDCEKQPKLEYHVCQTCERESKWWSD